MTNDAQTLLHEVHAKAQESHEALLMPAVDHDRFICHFSEVFLAERLVDARHELATLRAQFACQIDETDQ